MLYCGITKFSHGIWVKLILNCGILETRVIQFFNILDSIKNYPSSPPQFSKPFPVCFGNRLKQ